MKIITSLALLLCLIFISCTGLEKDLMKSNNENGNQEIGNTDLKYEFITFDYVGTNSIKNVSGSYEGLIKPEGETFTLVPSEKYKFDAYVSEFIETNGEKIIGQSPFVNNFDFVISSTSGKVSYTDSPYSINITINKNESGEKRRIIIRIGGVLKYCMFYLSQDSI